MLEQSVARPKSDPEVYCKSRKKVVSVLDCIDGYVTANAIPVRRSACYRCLQGQRTRCRFASS
jgi:hypothetical protein